MALVRVYKNRAFAVGKISEDLRADAALTIFGHYLSNFRIRDTEFQALLFGEMGVSVSCYASQ
jgi:hypothetical protein